MPDCVSSPTLQVMTMIPPEIFDDPEGDDFYAEHRLSESGQFSLAIGRFGRPCRYSFSVSFSQKACP